MSQLIQWKKNFALTGFDVGWSVGFVDGVLVCKKQDENVSVFGLI